MSDEIVLTVGGKRYAGWESARVTRGIETIAGGFTLSVSERWAGQNVNWPIERDDECSVSVNGETLITGYVSEVKPSYDAGGHTLEITGRDKTADLVDCSALLDHWEFKNVDVFKLAKKVCAPFGIKVSVQPGLTFRAVEKLSISVGEKAFNVIEQACRLAAVLPIAGDDGELVLTQAGSERATTELVEGENIKRAEASFSVTERYRKYVVLGQHAASDEFFGAAAAQIRGEAEDPNVKRAARVLVIRAEGNATAAYAKLRAQWEATTRAARADPVSITVQGWTQASGALWPVNALVRVRSPRLQVNGDMLITQATYAVDDGGTTTALSLKRPDAFKPEPSVSGDGLWREISRGV